MQISRNLILQIKALCLFDKLHTTNTDLQWVPVYVLNQVRSTNIAVIPPSNGPLGLEVTSTHSNTEL